MNPPDGIFAEQVESMFIICTYCLKNGTFVDMMTGVHRGGRATAASYN
jgi:hypothetical protein